MKEPKSELNNHHPYCQETYKQLGKFGRDWTCRCQLLKDYDKWKLINDYDWAEEIHVRPKKRTRPEEKPNFVQEAENAYNRRLANAAVEEKPLRKKK